MHSDSSFPPVMCLRVVVVLVLLAGRPLAQAATVWNGPITTYSQPGSDPSQAANQDRLTDRVWLTRTAVSGMFNGKSESFYTHFVSPADTEWAVGSLENFASLTYASWETTGAGRPVLTLVGKQLVLHLITDDIYLSVKFTQLGARGAGRFAYERSTPGGGAPPVPSVSITNPAAGTMFDAPANVNVAASATVSSGTVTNVAFFGNGDLLGSSQTDPFSITANNLAAGNYVLTAVATAAGISATSSVVNITVTATTPSPTVTITNPLAGATFVAPANVVIASTSTVSSGTVTNVAFFGNGTLFGSSQTEPFNITANNLIAGNYALTAVATAAGISATSSVVNITVTAPTPPPTVTITNPLVGATFVAPANVVIASTATVSSGTVTNVAFFGNGILLGSSQTEPFSITANNLIAGDYALTAVATAAGISATSTVVNITVTAPTPPPTVTITNPLAGATFVAPANVVIASMATVSSGTVTNVVFFGNGTLLGSSQNEPFSITANNLMAANYALTAVATAAGISATSTVVNITVTSPAPTVSITSPLAGASFTALATLVITADASVSNGVVTNVAFFSNGTLLGFVPTAPFTLIASNLVAGNYALTAVATAAGISTTSSPVNITVTSSLPAVSIINPTPGKLFSAPANIAITAEASVNNGTITNVAFFGNGTLFGSVQTTPFTLIASNLLAGDYALSAIATAAGISTTSLVVNVSVVVPANVLISAQSISNGIHSFDYTVNPGLTYRVQASSNLLDWLSVITNVPTANPAHFFDNFVPNGIQFYRVELLPDR